MSEIQTHVPTSLNLQPCALPLSQTPYNALCYSSIIKEAQKILIEGLYWTRAPKVATMVGAVLDTCS